MSTSSWVPQSGRLTLEALGGLLPEPLGNMCYKACSSAQCALTVAHCVWLAGLDVEPLRAFGNPVQRLPSQGYDQVWAQGSFTSLSRVQKIEFLRTRLVFHPNAKYTHHFEVCVYCCQGRMQP